MGNFSVKAILSAVDRNFSSTMKSALGYTNNLKDTLKSGFGFGVLMGAGQQAFSAIAGSVKCLSNETVETSDSMQKLQQAMRFSGYAESEIQRIAGATGTLKTYADKTVFSLQDVMSTFGALSANGIQDADKMTEAVGNAVAVFGGGAKEFSAVGLAYSQAMAAGALHAQDWNQILNASPQLAGGLKKELIKLNPVLGEDFKQAMEDGAITADLLGQAMNNIGMTDLAKEAATSVTTFEGAMGNLQATAVSGMMGLYDTFAKSTVIDAINKFNEKVGAGFDWLNANIPNAIAKIRPYWMAFKSDFDEVKVAFGDAVSAIGDSLSELTGAFGTPQNIKSFSDGLGVATDALKTFAGFCEEHSDTIAKLITKLPKLYIAYRGFKIVKAVAPFVGAFTGAIGGLAKMGLSKIAPKLFGVAKGQDAVGKSSEASSKKMLTSAKSFMMLGAGVLAVSAGFYLLAQSAVAVADAGPLAVGVLAGLVGTVTALSVGMLKMLSSMSGGTKKLAAMSTAMLALGASLLLISTGFWVLSDAAINLANAGPLAIATMAGMVVAVGALLLVAKAVAPALTAGAVGFVAFGAAVIFAGAGMMVLTTAAINLANAGPLAIGVMAGMVLAIAGLVLGVAALGPTLTAGAVGFIAFGAAIVLVGAGAVIAAAALMMVSTVLPTIVTYGTQGAVAIATLGASMIVFAVGATVAGASCLVLGAGLALVGAALLVVSASVLIIGAGMMLIGTGALSAATGLAKLASSLPKLAAGAFENAAGLTVLAVGLTIFGSAAMVAGAGAVVLGAALIVVSAGLSLLGTGSMLAYTGLSLLSALFPVISEYGLQASDSLLALGASLAVFGAGALVVSAAVVVLGAGLLVASTAVLVLCAGVLVLSVAMMAISVSAIAAVAALSAFVLLLPALTSNGSAGASIVLALGSALLVFSVGALAAGASCLPLTAGLLMFGAAMTTGAVGTLAMVAALKAVNSSMKSIASNAKTANSSIKSMVGAVDVVNAGLDALGNKAKSTVNKMISIFSGASGKATSAANTMMNGYNTGISTGGARAVATSRSITNSIVAALGSARSGAYSSGYYIGQGFANGMASTLGYVRSVATQLAAAADAAIVAKAKIGSPSKVTTKLGKWYGIGWVNGIKNEVKAARNAAKELVQMPKLPRYNDMELQFAGTGGMTLNDDYDYSADYKIYLELTSNIDGREVSKATAKYDKDELEKLQKISNRIKGIR